MDNDGEGQHLLVPGLMSDMSIKGPVFWMSAGWWTDTPVQKLWGFPVWLNSVSVTGIVALSSPMRGRMNISEKQLLQAYQTFDVKIIRSIAHAQTRKHTILSVCLSSSHQFVWCLLCPQLAAALWGCQCVTVGPEEVPSLGCQSFGCFY